MMHLCHLFLNSSPSRRQSLRTRKHSREQTLKQSQLNIPKNLQARPNMPYHFGSNGPQLVESHGSQSSLYAPMSQNSGQMLVEPEIEHCQYSNMSITEFLSRPITHPLLTIDSIMYINSIRLLPQIKLLGFIFISDTVKLNRQPTCS